MTMNIRESLRTQIASYDGAASHDEGLLDTILEFCRTDILHVAQVAVSGLRQALDTSQHDDAVLARVQEAVSVLTRESAVRPLTTREQEALVVLLQAAPTKPEEPPAARGGDWFRRIGDSYTAEAQRFSDWPQKMEANAAEAAKYYGIADRMDSSLLLSKVSDRV